MREGMPRDGAIIFGDLIGELGVLRDRVHQVQARTGWPS